MTIGKSKISCEAHQMKEIHKFSSVWGMLPNKCDECGSDHVYLYHKNPEGNDYYGIKCKDCGAELNLHQKKLGGFYIKNGEKMQVYRANNGTLPAVGEKRVPSPDEFDVSPSPEF